jgi:hypothetical protein
MRVVLGSRTVDAFTPIPDPSPGYAREKLPSWGGDHDGARRAIETMRPAGGPAAASQPAVAAGGGKGAAEVVEMAVDRSEEHTSELQSHA